jgi:putative membrane protein
MSQPHGDHWRSRFGIVIVVSTMGASAALAHDGTLYGPPDLWTMWSWEPGVIICLTLSAWLYGQGVRSVWRAAAVGHGLRRWEVTAFGVGWLALWVALTSPLHTLGGILFSAHMIQHEILMLVAAPLLVLGKPFIAGVWGLPLVWRHRLGWLGNQKLVRRSWHMLRSPLLTWLFQAGALWIWHAPGLFQAALESASIHALQHLSFLVSALLFFWWALIHGRQGVREHGAAVLSVFTTSLHSSALGALLTFAVAPWYPTYQGNTALWGVTPVEDQQLAGLIMWVPTSALYLCAGLGLCARWLYASDVRELQRKGQALPQRQSVEDGQRRTTRSRHATAERMLMGWLLIILVGLSSCNGDLARETRELTGGDPGNGPVAIRQHGCPACHTIPGVRGAYGLVGPPLGGIASRIYIAGMLPNTPDNMMRWIQAPQEVKPHTAMPNMGIPEPEARDIVGYLYTLK